MQIVAIFIVIICSLKYSCTATSNYDHAMSYMSQFGYLEAAGANSTDDVDKQIFSKAIGMFQEFAGMEPTGILDEQTMTMMKLPRCGMKDMSAATGSKSERFELQGTRWLTKNLTYRISKYPSKLKRSDVDREIQRAFNVWSGYTDLIFTPRKERVHIDISFVYGAHGDDDPFDGPGQVLAHAYFPEFEGTTHFDASEKWSIKSFDGTNLFQVATHEFGHALGLRHSRIQQAVMAPFYRGYLPSFRLQNDDISGIQALYGKKSLRVGTDGGDDNNLCTDPTFDTIFISDEGYTYLFKGDKYWNLTMKGLAPGYPKLISENWPGLPSNIDAAFTHSNGKTYFFKGSQYWRYKGTQSDGDYPKEISLGFTGIPNDVDTAMIFSQNNKIYFLKGNQFWRFDPMKRPAVSSTYPKPISNFIGIPNDISAAFQNTDGNMYFFKDEEYYRFNDKTFSVEKAVPAYPRPTAYWWFGCKETQNGTNGSDDPTGVQGNSEDSDEPDLDDY